jgi:hypothetical protein
MQRACQMQRLAVAGELLGLWRAIAGIWKYCRSVTVGSQRTGSFRAAEVWTLLDLDLP